MGSWKHTCLLDFGLKSGQTPMLFSKISIDFCVKQPLNTRNQRVGANTWPSHEALSHNFSE
jgi:hypothetical protein